MNLYLRLVWTYLRAMLQPMVSMHETTRLELRVLPNDLDLNRHMNNGRFMTVLDLAIIDILTRTRFLRVVRSMKGYIVNGGALITFRQQLTPFARYRLKLRYLGCNPHWHVFSFVFLNSKGTVAARGLVKGGVVRRRAGLLSADQIWKQFRVLYDREVQPPVLPAYAQDWLDLETTVSHMPYGDEADSQIDAGFTTRPADQLPQDAAHPEPALARRR